MVKRYFKADLLIRNSQYSLHQTVSNDKYQYYLVWFYIFKMISYRLALRPKSTKKLINNNKRRGTFDSAKNHKRQRRKRQSVTAKREKSQTPKFV